MNRKDWIAVRNKIAEKLDDETRVDFMAYSSVMPYEFGGASEEYLKAVLDGNKLEDICFDKFKYLTKNMKDIKYAEDIKYAIVEVTDGDKTKIGVITEVNTDNDSITVIFEDGSVSILGAKSVRESDIRVVGRKRENLFEAMKYASEFAKKRDLRAKADEVKAKVKAKTEARAEAKAETKAGENKAEASEADVTPKEVIDLVTIMLNDFFNR